MAGLHRAEGEYVVIMDDDFQNSPSDAVRLVEETRDGGFDVVYSRYPELELAELLGLALGAR